MSEPAMKITLLDVAVDFVVSIFMALAFFWLMNLETAVPARSVLIFAGINAGANGILDLVRRRGWRYALADCMATLAGSALGGLLYGPIFT